MKKLLVGLSILVAGVVITGCVAERGPGYGYSDYPATYVAPAPITGSVYIEGDWYNDGGHWHRHAGRWERPPYAGAHYRQGYWGTHHEWHNGEWRR